MSRSGQHMHVATAAASETEALNRTAAAQDVRRNVAENPEDFDVRVNLNSAEKHRQWQWHCQLALHLSSLNAHEPCLPMAQDEVGHAVLSLQCCSPFPPGHN